MAGKEMKPERIAAGTDIFNEGDPGDKMYVVKEGDVDLSINGKIVASVGVGGIFGEMALIDNKPRSATAHAKINCVLVPINEARFLELVHQKPSFALEVMKVLVERLRLMDTKA